MNNKGQSLVLFVLLIPLLFMLLILVYDIGSMVLLKQELDSINYIALDYGVSNITEVNLEDKLKKIIDKNKNDIDNVEIKLKEEYLYITLEDRVDTKISLIKDISVFKIKSSFVGYKKNDKVVIERNK